jgi:hypothetical protein
VDTGGGSFLVAESLAKDIGLNPSGPAIDEGEGPFFPAPRPKARLGEVDLELNEGKVLIVAGSRSIAPGSDAEGLLPGHVLAKYAVVFDYPAGSFTIARPATLSHKGIKLPAPVNQRSGFPRIELELGGQPYGFLLDTGATYTMMSKASMERWTSEHTDWKTASGAAGLANMIGDPMEAGALLMRIPEMKWGPFSIKDTGVVSRPAGAFEKYMSGMMAAPIVGSIGGNVLRAFRVEIDYPTGSVYLEQTGSMEKADLDVVPITISPSADGFKIAGMSNQLIIDPPGSIHPGDKLIAIGNRPLRGLTLFQALAALKGRPGEKKALTVEREGKTIKVTVTVVHLL